MEVGFVNSGSKAYANVSRQATEKRQTEELRNAQQSAQTESNKREQVRQQEAPKPVVNTQGQKTGTKVNVTA